MRNKMIRRLLACLTSLCMVVGRLPASVSAAMPQTCSHHPAYDAACGYAKARPCGYICREPHAGAYDAVLKIAGQATPAVTVRVRFEVTPDSTGFVAVTDIRDIPASMTAGTPLVLTGTVQAIILHHVKAARTRVTSASAAGDRFLAFR